MRRSTPCLTGCGCAPNWRPTGPGAAARRGWVLAALAAGWLACNSDSGPGTTDGPRFEAGASDFGGPPADGHGLEGGPPRDWGPATDAPGAHDATTPAPLPVAVDRCAQAQTLQLGNAAQKLSGSTATFTDEFAVECGPTIGNKTLAGPQAYYRLAGQAGRWYRLILEPQFTATMILFSSSACTKPAIEADCQSGGSAGFGSRSIEAGKRQALYMQVPAGGAFYVGVDSTEAARSGPFDLIVEPFAPPTNTTCQTAQGLTFAGNTVTVTGDTAPNFSPAEFPTMKCDITTMGGPQVYYRFDATAGTTYQIALTADAGQFLYSYVWGAGCDQGSIATDCSSEGATGDILAMPLYSGESRTMSFAPPKTGVHHLAVGSNLPFNFGSFKLTVSY